jgi:hypothetical protein
VAGSSSEGEAALRERWRRQGETLTPAQVGEVLFGA